MKKLKFIDAAAERSLRSRSTEELLDELFVQQNSVRKVEADRKEDPDIEKCKTVIAEYKLTHENTDKIKRLKEKIKDYQDQIKEELHEEYYELKEARKEYTDQIRNHKEHVFVILNELEDRKIEENKRKGK